jgi:BirA family biotin operon repressor/biotin-[acetyl-CoA-carboxylase] ligase
MTGSDAKQELLLGRLRERAGQFVSGSELAEALGVSRAAVGKRIATLRGSGYEIEAVHNRGYRLVGEADPIDAAELQPLLQTRWLGRVYFAHPRLASSNELAGQLASEGAPHGTVVVADAQEAGRGRFGRVWHSPAGEGLYLSAVLRPRIDPAEAPPISLAAAVAVAEAVRGFLGHPPSLKWPNDLLCGGRKLGGILIEMQAEPGRLRHLVVGIGLNVNTVSFPAELEGRATSLRIERGTRVRRAPVIAALLHALERWVDRVESEGPAPVIAAWLELADLIGRQVSVSVGAGGEPVRGVALGLDPGGRLRLQREDGRIEVLHAGELRTD